MEKKEEDEEEEGNNSRYNIQHFIKKQSPPLQNHLTLFVATKASMCINCLLHR